MNPRRYVIPVAAAAGGAGTGTPTSPAPVNQPVTGHVKAVQYIAGGTPFADSTTFVLTATDPVTGAVQTILSGTLADGDIATGYQWAPRQPTHTAAAAAALYASAGQGVLDDFVLCDENLSIAVASAGGVSNGTFVVIVE